SSQRCSPTPRKWNPRGDSALRTSLLWRRDSAKKRIDTGLIAVGLSGSSIASCKRTTWMIGCGGIVGDWRGLAMRIDLIQSSVGHRLSFYEHYEFLSSWMSLLVILFRMEQTDRMSPVLYHGSGLRSVILICINYILLQYILSDNKQT